MCEILVPVNDSHHHLFHGWHMRAIRVPGKSGLQYQLPSRWHALIVQFIQNLLIIMLMAFGCCPQFRLLCLQKATTQRHSGTAYELKGGDPGGHYYIITKQCASHPTCLPEADSEKCHYHYGGTFTSDVVPFARVRHDDWRRRLCSARFQDHRSHPRSEFWSFLEAVWPSTKILCFCFSATCSSLFYYYKSSNSYMECATEYGLIIQLNLILQTLQNVLRSKMDGVDAQPLLCFIYFESYARAPSVLLHFPY